MTTIALSKHYSLHDTSLFREVTKEFTQTFGIRFYTVFCDVLMLIFLIRCYLALIPEEVLGRLPAG